MKALTFDRSLQSLLVAGAVLLLVLPLLIDVATLVSVSVFVIFGILSLSMGLVWGGAGIFSFGQSMFFGIGAYVYAVATMNLGDSSYGIVLGLVAAAIFALALGYFMFYGRIGDLYLAVITLTMSLLLYQLVNSGAGAHFTIGSVALGGYNGIPAVPPLNVPGDPDNQLDYTGTYLIAVVALIVVYVGLRYLMASRFGACVIAIRENELRAELLGYDSRAYRLIVFVLSAVIASASGILFAAWGNFIGPDVFSLVFAGQIIIWTMVGGVGLLAGPLLGCFILQALTTWLGTLQLTDTNIVLGALFVIFVLLLPSGLLPGLRALVVRRHADG